MSSRALWICSLLVIVPVHSFIVHKQLSIVGRRHYYVIDDHSSILRMGGYYVEPESTRPATGQGQHMIFGIRCIEETLVVDPTLQLKNLLPVSEDEGRSTEGSDKASRLLQYLFHDVDLKNKSVVEIGATGVSIAALAWGATSVVVCHPDSDRLKLWEHSVKFFNDKALQGTYQVLTSKCLVAATKNDQSVHHLLNHTFDMLQRFFQPQSLLRIVYYPLLTLC